MGKSGSTFLCNLQEDMLALSGVRSGQAKLRENFEGRWVKNFPLNTIIKLLWINFRNGSIVIKTHTPPTRYVRWLIQLRIAKATYSYRDVRDVILSALDHGARNRKQGKTTEIYADLFTVEEAMYVGTNSIKAMQRWQQFGLVHFVRYEFLMNDRLNELIKMKNFFDWDIGNKEIDKLIEDHEKTKRASLNFNKGITKRYKTEMTTEEKLFCNEKLKDYLVGLGYDIEVS